MSRLGGASKGIHGSNEKIWNILKDHELCSGDKYGVKMKYYTDLKHLWKTDNKYDRYNNVGMVPDTLLGQ